MRKLTVIQSDNREKLSCMALNVPTSQGWRQKSFDRGARVSNIRAKMAKNIHLLYVICQNFLRQDFKFPPMGARCFQGGAVVPLASSLLLLLMIKNIKYSRPCLDNRGPSI